MHKNRLISHYKGNLRVKINFWIALLFSFVIIGTIIVLSKVSFPMKNDFKKPLYLTMNNQQTFDETKEKETNKSLLYEKGNAEINKTEKSFDIVENSYIQALSNISNIRILNHITGEIFSLPIEEYVIGSVLAEMPSSFNSEAIKAQAVACRTFAADVIIQNQDSEYDISTDFNKGQGYISAEEFFLKYGKGAEEVYKNITSVVNLTKGIIILYKGLPIKAFFHASSPAFTVTSEDVWGGKFDYLVSVPAVETVENTKDYLYDKSFSRMEIIRLLERAGYNIPDKLSDKLDSDWIYIEDITLSETVENVNVGGIKISGVDFRNALLLRSADFEFSYENDIIIITTKGYGHGVGMSQNGANILAERGYHFYDILKYYYKDIVFGFIGLS